MLLVALASCTGGSTRGEQTSPEGPMARSIEEVQDTHTPEWMGLPGVVGTGIALCDGQPCIKVFVSGPVEPLQGLIPSEVEGYRVVLESTGRFQARDSGGGA
jgi:hypothetical protein